MKIDIKNIVKSLSAGGGEPESTDKAMSIRQVIDEMKESSDSGESEGLEDAAEPEAEAGEEAEEITDDEASETEEKTEVEPENPEKEADPEDEPEETEAESEAEKEPEEPAAETVKAAAEVDETPEMAETEDEAEDVTEETEPKEPEEHEIEAETEEESEENGDEAESKEPEKAESEAVTEEVPEAVEPSDDEQPPAETEAPEDAEPTEAAKSAEPSKLLVWGKKYGWLTGIAASFLILIAFMVIYTTMTPREIFATIDGERIAFTTEEHTIADFLEAENIDFCEEDRISVPLEAFIQEGIEFELVHAKDFTVTADGETKEYKSLDLTVKNALDDVGIMVGELDIVKPKLDTLLAQGMSVIVKRVVIKEEVVEKTIPFRTIQKDDTTMMEGKSKVLEKGRDGKAEVTYEVKYVDGKEASRKKVDRKIITKARHKVVANGTMVNYNGKKYSRKLVVKAYAYTGGGTTAMGTRARVGEIAVDPSVIPLGTNVYIEGVGPRRAEDTGGNIKGNTIDIYMDTHQECINWGMRYVTIYIE